MSIFLDLMSCLQGMSRVEETSERVSGTKIVQVSGPSFEKSWVQIEKNGISYFG